MFANHTTSQALLHLLPPAVYVCATDGTILRLQPPRRWAVGPRAIAGPIPEIVSAVPIACTNRTAVHFRTMSARWPISCATVFPFKIGRS